MKLAKNPIVEEVARHSERLISGARGTTLRDEDEIELSKHMSDYIANCGIPVATISQMALEALYTAGYNKVFRQKTKSKPTKQGDMFGSGLPEAIALANTGTYVLMEYANERQIETWMNQKRANVRAATEKMYIDEDVYMAVVAEMRSGNLATVGEAIDSIRHKLSQEGKEA